MLLSEEPDELIQALKERVKLIQPHIARCELIEVLSHHEQFEGQYDSLFSAIGSALKHDNITGGEAASLREEAAKVRSDFLDSIVQGLEKKCGCKST